MKKLFLAVLMVLAVSLSAFAGDSTLKLTILHTNDLHGQILTSEDDGTGGSARLATLVRQIRNLAPKSTLLIDAGDIFTRGPYAQDFKGQMEIDMMNKIGYDIGCIGNNEFKGSGTQEEAMAILKARLAQAKFSWVTGNVFDKATGKYPANINPYVIKNINGVRIAFIGLTAENSAEYEQTQGLKILPVIETAKKLVAEVQKKADIIIAVTHIGDEADKVLAAKVPGLAAIVGGHSHTTLLKPLDVKGVPIVQAGEYGMYLGKLDLTFVKGKNGKWKLKQYKGELLPVNNKIPEASDVKGIIDTYLKTIDEAA